MRLLLTNDDGWDSPGITILKKALKEAGHSALVLAPHENQSAKSHSMRTEGELELFRHEDDTYSLTGTPADTIIFFDTSPYFSYFTADAVISGINKGLNVSSDVIYSGTCGGAREAALRGYPAIALSCQLGPDRNSASFEIASQFLISHLDAFITSLIKKGRHSFFLNINVPFEANALKYRTSSLSPLDYLDIISEEEKFEEKENEEVKRFSINFPHDKTKVSEMLRDKACSLPCDMDVISKGTISLTCIRAFPSWDNSHLSF